MLRQVLAGIVIIALAGLAAYRYWPEEMPVCQICLRPMHQATSMFVALEGGQEVELCCPRCGLRFMEDRTDVRGIEVTDYSSRTRLPAADAVYVSGSSIHPCCSAEEILKDRSGVEYERTWDRCLPSVIAFSSRQNAEAFQLENGGEIRTYQELQAEESAGSGQ
jgi:hypothetical protein